jgi:glucans biosynthesis protein
VDDEGKNGGRLFIVDFVGGDLPFLKDDQPLEGVVSVSSGRVANVTAHRNPALKGWRLFFDFFPEGSQSAELRGFMRLRGRVLTETWSYLWTSQ